MENTDWRLKPIHIEATTISDAWFQTVFKCLEVGRGFTIDRGSYKGTKRLEFDYITVHIKFPGLEPRIPQIPEQYNLPNPVEDEYVNEYMPYLMTAEIEPGEAYTYGQRMTRYPIDENYATFLQEKVIVVQEKEVWDPNNIVIKEENGEYDHEWFLNQMELLIWTYKNKGHRNNQMVLQVAHPTDMLLQDPPCLRHIDTRIQDGKLHFIIYFRSWDLWGGFPANLAGLQQVKEHLASEIGVEDGEMICSSKGLHLYNYTWELAECIRGKTIAQFQEGK